MLPTLMPAAMAFLTSSTMPAPYSGWVMIASYLPEATASWSCLTWSAGIQVRVEDGQVGVPGGRGGLGRCEHRGVVAVGDRERQVGDLEASCRWRSGPPRRSPRRSRRWSAPRRWRPPMARSTRSRCCRRRPGGSPTANSPASRLRRILPDRISAHVTSPPHRSGRSPAIPGVCRANEQVSSRIAMLHSVSAHFRAPQRHVIGCRERDLRSLRPCVAWMNATSRPRARTRHGPIRIGDPVVMSTTRLARLDERRLGRALERRSAAHLPHDACPRRRWRRPTSARSCCSTSTTSATSRARTSASGRATR